MNNFKILDCTLRDGGYYTNWDFNPQLVEKYLKTMDELPIDYIEIGYRNLKQSVYKGEFFYSPLETLKKAIGHFYDQPDVIKKLQEFEILIRE